MRRRKRSFQREGAKRHIPRRRRREAVGYKGCEAGRKAPHKCDRASACDEVACVITALGFNKKKSHPYRKRGTRSVNTAIAVLTDLGI